MHCFFKRILQADVLPDGLMMLHDRILRKEIVTFAFVLSSTQKILNRAEATVFLVLSTRRLLKKLIYRQRRKMNLKPRKSKCQVTKLSPLV